MTKKNDTDGTSRRDFLKLAGAGAPVATVALAASSSFLISLIDSGEEPVLGKKGSAIMAKNMNAPIAEAKRSSADMLNTLTSLLRSFICFHLFFHLRRQKMNRKSYRTNSKGIAIF